MKAPIGVDQDSGLIHVASVTVATVQEVTMAAELLPGEERVMYGNAGYQVLEKREEMAGGDVECGIAMGPVQRRRLPETAEGQLLDWLERAKAHVRSKVEHPFGVVKQEFDFQKTRLRGLGKKHCKVMVLAALTNVFFSPHMGLGTLHTVEQSPFWCLSQSAALPWSHGNAILHISSCHLLSLLQALIPGIPIHQPLFSRN